MYERKPVEDNLTEMPARQTLESMDIAEERRAQLKQLFPEVFNENKVDFERLQRVLGEQIDTGKERYGLTWPGKANCMKVIQEPSRATLKPCREESVDFDNTENLFIEGDNLEVLKLLQKSYFGKVKMIYIDPPYNTGKEFIYPDNYQETIETYLSYAGLVNNDGKVFNTKDKEEAKTGRLHSNWLSMIYPRLYLAKNLLREDGVIFISIDYREAPQLRALMNEIFGEENLIFDVAVVNNLKGRNDREGIATCHEQLLIYCKSGYEPRGLPLTDDKLKEYKETDEKGEAFQWRDLRKRGGPDTRIERPKMFFPIFVDPKTGKVSLKKTETCCIEAYPRKSNGEDGRWRWGLDTVKENISIIRGSKVNGKEHWNISYRVYLNTDGKQRRFTPKSIWTGPNYSTDVATKALASLFPGIQAKNFTPKPLRFIQDIIDQSTGKDDVILDFFSGTGSTAIATILQNVKEKSDRRYIAIQLPEKIESGLTDKEKEINTIADLAKERIRRTIRDIAEETGNSGQLDLGFRVYKLDKSHFGQWQSEVESGNVAQLQANLELHSSHIDKNADQEALLYELLLKAGFELTESIEQQTFVNQQAFSVAEGVLLICLEDRIEPETLEAMVKAEPAEIIVKDSAFAGNDQLKVNAVQTVKAYNQNSETDIVFKVV